MDGTSAVPFVLEIFASSQPEIFHGLYPSKYYFIFMSITGQAMLYCPRHYFYRDFSHMFVAI